MYSLDEIQKPIERELQRFSEYFTSALENEQPEIQEIINYILKTQGKRMRPLFLLLTAALHGEINHKSYVAATLIELMHTASLVHDDIVDEAYQRRNRWSVNALWRSKKAVLIGDYILARGIRTAVDNELYDIIREISFVIEDMSKGELIQADASLSLDISRDEYFEIIRCKTASLLSACSSSGARSTGASPEAVECMRQFGNLLGLAFQIKDDLLDYNQTDRIGKPVLNDIKERKMTLPLIEALECATEPEKEKVRTWLREADDDRSAARKVYEFVVRNGGLQKAATIMEQQEREALRILETYPASPYKEALIKYADYILNRKK